MRKSQQTLPSHLPNNLPWKLGLIFFMVHFWIFFFLFEFVPQNTPYRSLLQVIVFIIDFPAALLSFFGMIHLMAFDEGGPLVHVYILTIGSLLYFGFGYLVGLFLIQKQAAEKNKRK